MIITFLGILTAALSLSTTENLEKDPEIQTLNLNDCWREESGNWSPLSYHQLEQHYEMLQAKGRDQPLELQELLEKLMLFLWHPREAGAGSGAATSTVITWQPTDLDGFLFCLSLKPSLAPKSLFGKCWEAQIWLKLSGITGSPHVRSLGADGPLLMVLWWQRNVATAQVDTKWQKHLKCYVYAYNSQLFL